MSQQLQPSCQTCGSSHLQEITGFPNLPRVTSDSKPFRQGGRLFVCEHCALVQKIADDAWLHETREIYHNYEMYHQSAGNDQAVFDPVSGMPSGRCEVLARRLQESGVLPHSGNLLDVGAGSGAMLAAFSTTCEHWTLFGLDLDNRKEAALRTIPRFEQLFTIALEQLSRQFDLITLIHSLEHFPDPLSMLCTLRGKIASQGHLFVQVNNVGKTPFDLVVADHLCHFTPDSLVNMAAHANLRVETAKIDWVNKEISLLAGLGPQAAESVHDSPQQVISKIQHEIAWLSNMLEHACACARNGQFGIFGTSVAATWLAGGLSDRVEFFVDEDPAREGHTHLGRPILKPGQIPTGATVYLAFVGSVSSAISRRLASLPVKFISPPNG